MLAARAGIDRKPMIRAQRAVLEPSIAALEQKLGQGSEAEQIYVRFRLDTTRAVLGFLDDLLETTPPSARAKQRSVDSG